MKIEIIKQQKWYLKQPLYSNKNQLKAFNNLESSYLWKTIELWERMMRLCHIIAYNSFYFLCSSIIWWFNQSRVALEISSFLKLGMSYPQELLIIATSLTNNEKNERLKKPQIVVLIETSNSHVANYIPGSPRKSDKQSRIC